MYENIDWDKVLPLITLIVGSLLTFLIQNFILHRQRSWDAKKLALQFDQEQSKMDKQFNYELEKQERQFAREQLLKKMDVYNKILRAIEESQVVEWPRHHLEEPHFNHRVYEEKIKPLLYESFHLLNKQVAEAVIRIDDMLGKWNYFEEADEGDPEQISEDYHLIKKIIVDELEDFRKTYIKSDYYV